MYDVFEKLCAEKGVTPYRVCKETGLTTSTISNWKAGRYTPKTDKLQKIADFFGVSIEFLMTGEEKEQEPIYYTNDETAKAAQEIFENDKVLFDVYRSADKERLVEYAKRLKALRDMEEGEI